MYFSVKAEFREEHCDGACTRKQNYKLVALRVMERGSGCVSPASGTDAAAADAASAPAAPSAADAADADAADADAAAAVRRRSHPRVEAVTFCKAVRLPVLLTIG